MFEKIISFFACLLCSLPFLIVSINKNSKEPIAFWSCSWGSKALKEKVKNIYDYNEEMKTLYKKYAISFFITGIICLINFKLGIVIISVNCTVGLFVLYEEYAKILKKYS